MSSSGIYAHLMEPSINISLPPLLRKWVRTQVSRNGYKSTDEFLLDVLRREQLLENREHVDALLIESLESGESEPLTAKMWDRIRSSGRKLATQRRRK